MTTHLVHIVKTDDSRIRLRHGPLLRDLLDILVDGCQQATRLRVDGRSTAPGTVPGWLEDAASFEILDIAEDRMVLGAPPLEQATLQRLRERELSSDVDPTRSSLDFLEDSLEDAIGGRADSERFDRNLMVTMEALGRLFRYGIERIEVVNGRKLEVDRRAVETIRQLRSRTPEDRRVMVAGKLETIRHSDGAFTLLLDSGEAIRGLVVSEQIEPAHLAALFGQPTLVTGVAKFRPSGAILRVEAERLQPAPGDVSVWSQAPKPLDASLDVRAVRRAQGPRSGIAAIFGQWPGDETEEEFLEAARDLS